LNSFSLKSANFKKNNLKMQAARFAFLSAPLIRRAAFSTGEFFL
jgi:hypothetical protein